MAKKPNRPRRKKPVGHVVMVVSGWALYLYYQNWPLLALAILFTLLGVLRYFRGSWELADERITRLLNEPTEPSDRVAPVLFDDEELLWECSDHPLSMVGWYIGGALLSAGMGSALFFIPFDSLKEWMVWAILIIWGGGLLAVLIKAMLWRRTRFCITNRRVFLVYGLFSVNHEFMPLAKMTNEQLRIPWHSRLLSWLRIIATPYGTFKPDAAGKEGKLGKVKYVPYAIQVNRVLMKYANG